MGAPDPIPLFGLGVQGKSRPANAQRRVNLYYEMQADQDRARMVAYQVPGLDTAFVDFGAMPSRGVIAPPTSDYHFVVHKGSFWQVDNAGQITSRGSIGTTSGKVSMAFDGRYIVVVDGDKGYYYDLQAPATPIAEITDADFPDGAMSVEEIDGFFVVEADDGQFYISDYGDPTAWPGDFATAETQPDGILRVLRDHQDLCLLGSESTEFWTNTGAPDFPFERIQGTTQEYGCAARHSIARFDGAYALLARNVENAVFAAVLRGYRFQRISNHELESRWRAFGSFSDAVGGGYMLDGHPMYVLSFPVGGESWLYDGSTNSWSQLKSYGLTRHRGEIYLNFQNRTLVTDYASGKVYRLNPDTYTDAGDPIRWELVGRHVFDGFGKMRVNRFQLDVETGVGLATGQGSDPQVMLRISRDGGRTFGIERMRSIGRVGEYKDRVIWDKCGRGRDFVFELAGSDPVPYKILGAGINARGATA